MNYHELLVNVYQKHHSLVCLGLDPVLEDIPLDPDNVYNALTGFYSGILDEIISRNVYPGACKPNFAFYSQYGIAGLEALRDIIVMYRNAGIPVILDSKRGDIASTALAYARETFDAFGADAVTLAPYMGWDSISPFTDNYPDKGFYILCKTSNKSSGDIQDLHADGEPVYIRVAELVCRNHVPGIGVVTGATYPGQLSRILDTFSKAHKPAGLLIPGIGRQGGDIEAVMSALVQSEDYRIHRINSSSAINYAWKNGNIAPEKFAWAAVNELQRMNDEISGLLERLRK